MRPLFKISIEFRRPDFVFIGLIFLRRKNSISNTLAFEDNDW